MRSREGEIPLSFLFSGTLFVRGLAGFSVEQVPWDREAVYRLPVAVWRDLMDRYFPDKAWVRISRHTLDRLQRYKADRAVTGWDDPFEHLFKEAGVEEP